MWARTLARFALVGARILALTPAVLAVHVSRTVGGQ